MFDQAGSAYFPLFNIKCEKYSLIFSHSLIWTNFINKLVGTILKFDAMLLWYILQISEQAPFALLNIDLIFIKPWFILPGIESILFAKLVIKNECITSYDDINSLILVLEGKNYTVIYFS